MSGLLADPVVQMALAAALGFVISEWRRGRDSHVNAVQVDTNLMTRVQHVEDWQREHNSIHGCVKELAATVKGMNQTIDRLTRRLDTWMVTNTYTPPRRARSPYDFDGREWIDPEPQV